MKRRHFSGILAVVAIPLAGCSSEDATIDGWDVQNREENAWNDFTGGMDVLRNRDTSTSEALEDAQEQLDDASEEYDQLSTDAVDNLDGDLLHNTQDFFNALDAAATAAGNVISLELGEEVPGGDDPDPFIDSLESHLDDAEDIYQDTDELQSGLIDRSFNI